MRRGNSGLPRVTLVTDIALETVYALSQEILVAVVHEALDAGLLPHVPKISLTSLHLSHGEISPGG